MADEGDEATISVKFTSSDKRAGQVSISLESTIGAFKNAIRSQFDTEPMRLIFQGRVLNNDAQTLAECKLKSGLTVIVQATPAGATPAPSSASGTPSAAGAAGATSSGSSTIPVVQAPARAVGSMGGVRSNNPVAHAVATIVAQPPGVARECFSTLVKIIDNIAVHPTEEKYRKIKRANAGFQRKVGGVNGGEACMRALGFTVTEPDQASWLLVPSAAAWDVLTTGRAQIQMASATLPASGNASAPAAPRASAGFAAGLGELPPPGMFPGPATFGGGPGGMATGMGGGMPDMGMIQRMAQDPAALQGMMNDPQVQAMMRSNPQMAAAMQGVMANPGMMSQAMSAMQRNPAMMQQAQRMMQDPTALQRASQMDLSGAMAAGLSAAQGQGGGAPPPSTGAFGGQGGTPVAPSTAAVPPPTGGAATGTPPAAGGQEGGGQEGGGQEEMTEDELIAEAIRRSMDDA